MATISRTLGCLIANFRPAGSFMLTVQRLAVAHTDESGIIFPIDPETNDLHLADFDGDGYWVMYKYDGSAWVIVAEIESSSLPNNNINEFYVNADSSVLLSQPNNITKPYTTILDAVTALTNSTLDASLEGIFGNSGYYAYPYLPNADTVYLNGDSYMLTNSELEDVVALNKRFRLVVDSYLYMFLNGANLGDISEDILDIRGRGSIYAIGSSQALLTAGAGLTAVNMDLASVYWQSVGGTPIFDFTHSVARIDLKINNLFCNNLNDHFWLPSESNQGCNISVDSVVISDTNQTAPYPEDFSGLLVPNSTVLGTSAPGKKYTNVSIGSIGSLLTPVSLCIFRSYTSLAKKYTNQTLNVNVGTVEGLVTRALDFGSDPLKLGRALICISNNLDDTNMDFTGSKLNFNINTISGDSTLLSLVGPFNGDLNITTNKKFEPASSSTALVELFNSTISNKVSVKGDYHSHVKLLYTVGHTYTLDNLFLEGVYKITDTGAFIRVDNATGTNDFTIILNNCKIIGDTAASLVNLVGGVAPASLTLICTNVSTNMMGLLPAWVTVEGTITQNVNFK